MENVIVVEKPVKPKVTCVCGSSINKNGLKKHEQTFKHLRYLEDNLKALQMRSYVEEQKLEPPAYDHSKEL